MDLHVRRVCQSASGGSYLVIYEAQIEITTDDQSVFVEIVKVEPEDAWRPYVEQAREAIRLGAETVLKPRGQGANIRVNRIKIHDVDFSPQMTQRFTSEELSKRLAEINSPES